MKRWVIAKKLKIKNLKFKIEDVVEVILQNRGLKTKGEKKAFLNPSSPYDLKAKDLEIDQKELAKAGKRIKKAIENKEKIIIYGDYDTDGVCATAILWETLWQKKAKVMPYIPTRDEGYGLRTEKLDELVKSGVSLVITVDHGVVAYEQVAHAQKIGLDVIVTDHHLPGAKKIKPTALIHTTKLCGAGVSWFLANQIQKQDLDLVTMGTITDLMPLTFANRAIVYHGLKHLQKTQRVGLKELFKIASIDQEKIGTYELGYIIGPRLNAAGRMEDPMDALRLVCLKDKVQAQRLAAKLDGQNRQRQSLMEEMTLQAREIWLKEDGKSNLIFVASEKWEHGIVGLVAGKLVEEFYRPAIVVALSKDCSRASARSIAGFDMVAVIRKTCGDLLTAFGGHAMAAGFTVETSKLLEVKKRLIKEAAKLTPESLEPRVKIDLEMSLANVSVALYEALQKMAPFGLGNPEPVFASVGLRLVEAKTVGAKGQHLKLRVGDPNSQDSFEAIGFGLGKLLETLSPDRPLDLAYQISENEWNGSRRLQLKIKDLH